MNEEVIGIYDDSFNQLLTGASPVRAMVSPQSKLMEHPVENGSTISDFAVTLPVELTLDMLLSGDDARNLYKVLVDLFQKKELLTVQTRAGVYPKMVIQAMPHDENAENMDVLPVTVKMKEVIIAETQFQALPPRQVEKPRNSSTVKRGQQQGRAEPASDGGERRSSTLYKIFNGGGT